MYFQPYEYWDINYQPQLVIAGNFWTINSMIQPFSHEAANDDKDAIERSNDASHFKTQPIQQLSKLRGHCTLR